MDNRLVLRSGKTIFLSSNPHDIVTVMVNFCKSEYGTIKKGWVVVDVGANIGAFTVYAKESGASKILAFEPNSEAYKVLERNVRENGFQQSVEIHKRAVAFLSGQTVYIPRSSSPYNKISGQEEAQVNVEAVRTMSLEEIISQVGRVDLLKLDCEGAEYSILLNSDKQILNKVDNIRMELHHSKKHSRKEVVDHLASSGFKVIHSVGNIFWFQR